MSAFSISFKNDSSNIEPAATVQFAGLPSFSFRYSQHFTENGSRSKLTIFDAPNLYAARENKPLPQPISMNDNPSSRCIPKNSDNELTASLILSSLRWECTKSCQFSPKEN